MTVPDGLFMYPESERQTAANSLHQQMYAKVAQTTTQLNARENISAQIANCFAFDACGDYTSSNWANPGIGIAVSGANMLAWPTPENGGTMGYNSRLVYQQAFWRPTYTWQASNTSGSLTVTVKNGNFAASIPGASVSVDSLPMGVTDNNGQVTLQAIQLGPQDIGAFFDPCANQQNNPTCTSPVETADKIVTIVTGHNQVTLTLCNPTMTNPPCVQQCATNLDCSAGFMCQNSACVPIPHKIRILGNKTITPSDPTYPIFLQDATGSGTTNTRSPSGNLGFGVEQEYRTGGAIGATNVFDDTTGFDVTCDPQSNPTVQYAQCISGSGPFTTTQSTSGPSGLTAVAPDSGSEFDLTVNCTADPASRAGFTSISRISSWTAAARRRSPWVATPGAATTRKPTDATPVASI